MVQGTLWALAHIEAKGEISGKGKELNFCDLLSPS